MKAHFFGEREGVLRYLTYLWLVLACTFPVFAAPAQPIGTITLLEGKGLLTRGATRYALSEGLRLEKGDIVELAEKSFAQAEFGPGAAVAVGPQTRMLLSTPGKGGGVELFVLQGQAKASAKGSSVIRLTTPDIVITVVNAATVLQSDASGVALFSENGETKAQETGGKPFVLKSGEFYSRKSEGKGETAPRPSSAFVTGLPRSFLDNLPSRLDKFKDVKAPPLKKVEDFSYAEVEPWLKSTVAVRKALVPRWRSKAREPVFRKALVENLKHHPEWDPILFPEKYEEAARAKEAAAKAKAATTNY